MKRYTVSILGMKKYSEGDFIIRLERHKGFSFESGQFIMVHAGETEKPFSIAFSNKREIVLLIKEHEQGAVTPYLAKVKKGEQLKISGPYGTLRFAKNTGKEIFFVAAGTGIAPFRCMVFDAVKSSKNKISLIYGFRDDFYFEKDFKKLEQKHKNFKIYGCCTGNVPGWKGRKGRVTEHLVDIIKNSNGKEVYVCGSRDMVESSKDVLIKSLGFKKEQIHVEEWK